MAFYKKGSAGTVTGPAEFDLEAACSKLFQAMEGLGTNEDVIIEVVANHTNEQRQQIKEKYGDMYDKDLEKDLEGELGGEFGKIVLALMKEPEEFILESINQAISGLGMDEYAIISLLCPRTNDELYALRKAYKKKYGNSMEDDLAEDLSDDFRSLLVGIMNGGRDESERLAPLKVQEDVEALRECSKGKGKGEDTFMYIFKQRSYAHLRAVFEGYKDYNRGEKEIEGLIEDQFSGSMQAAYLAMVKIFRNEQDFYAERLKEALKGAGTDDDTLIRIIVCRSEIDLKDIMNAYEEKYNTTLLEDVASDTGGNYKDILEILLTPKEEEDAE